MFIPWSERPSFAPIQYNLQNYNFSLKQATNKKLNHASMEIHCYYSSKNTQTYHYQILPESHPLFSSWCLR
jgi:hypothetical protein